MRHIQNRLEADFQGLIDLSDLATRRQSERDQAFLSRSLAAYAVQILADVPPPQASACVTDGFNDNGIDALYHDAGTRTLYVVQSKWISNGRGAPSQADVQAFVAGFRDLINAEFSRFNNRVLAHKQLLVDALDDPNVRFMLVLIHTGQQPLGQHPKRRLDDLEREINDPTEVVSYRVLGQGDVHRLVATQLEEIRIDLDVTLHEWGTIQDPYIAYYGQIPASDIAAWWRTHGGNLFARNLRHLIPVSDVNDSIVETLLNDPENFWYFNNGIKVLCNSVQKRPIGGSGRRVGQFRCEGVSVVNGAQTVGCIGAGADQDAAAVDRAWVSARFISLDNGSFEFAGSVTRATNTQNRIERRDFVSLDPQQHRLRRELELEGKYYAVKTSEADPSPTSGCSVTEASIALACAFHDPGYSVQAKRELGRLWADLLKPPYIDLFNASLSSLRLWRSVEILRVVDDELRQLQTNREGRDRAICVHGNRLVLHLVFAQLPVAQFDDPDLDFNAVKDRARVLVEPTVKKLIRQTQRLYPQSYVASLFKNASKSREIVQAVLHPRQRSAGS